jgi:transmembrane sensor
MNTHVNPQDNNSDSVRAEAAAWISRLHGPDRTSELEQGLRLWLAEDVTHKEVFERMTQSWEDATAIVVRQHFPRVRRPITTSRYTEAVAAAVMMLCGLGAFGAYSWFGRNTYSTDIGEQRTVRLDDASRISVNSASKVVVNYGNTVREVRLERGEAYFEVAKDPSRPFVVWAGNQRIEALGTVFTVRYDRDRTVVTLVDGEVAVSETGAQPEATFTAPSSRAPASPIAVKGQEPRILTAGQRLTLVTNKPAQLDAPKIDTVIAWRRGEVVLDKMSLADAVTEMNRYDSHQLRVEDAEIAALKVSGIYRSGDNANFARVVARMYGLEVDDSREDIRIRR